MKQDLSNRQYSQALNRVFSGDDGGIALKKIKELCEIDRDIYSQDALVMARATGKQSVYYGLKKIMEETK